MYTPVALIDKNLYDQSFWVEIATKLPDLAGDAGGTEHLVDRFVRQYLPVLLRSRTEDARDHVWLAFWNYLVAPRNRTKQFGLSGPTADLLIAEFQSALIEPN